MITKQLNKDVIIKLAVQCIMGFRLYTYKFVFMTSLKTPSGQQKTSKISFAISPLIFQLYYRPHTEMSEMAMAALSCRYIESPVSFPVKQFIAT